LIFVGARNFSLARGADKLMFSYFS
jgi:hypothetical protein